MEYPNQQRGADEMTDVLCGPAGDVTFDGEAAVTASPHGYIRVQHPLGGYVGFSVTGQVNADAVAGQLAGVIAAWVEAANRYHVEVTGCGPVGSTGSAVAGDVAATHREPVTAPGIHYPIVDAGGGNGIVWLTFPDGSQRLVHARDRHAADDATLALLSWVTAWIVQGVQNDRVER